MPASLRLAVDAPVGSLFGSSNGRQEFSPQWTWRAARNAGASAPPVADPESWMVRTTGRVAPV
jgi:hypothetical protein